MILSSVNAVLMALCLASTTVTFSSVDLCHPHTSLFDQVGFASTLCTNFDNCRRGGTGIVVILSVAAWVATAASLALLMKTRVKTNHDSLPTSHSPKDSLMDLPLKETTIIRAANPDGIIPMVTRTTSSDSNGSSVVTETSSIEGPVTTGHLSSPTASQCCLVGMNTQ